MRVRSLIALVGATALVLVSVSLFAPSRITITAQSAETTPHAVAARTQTAAACDTMWCPPGSTTPGPTVSLQQSSTQTAAGASFTVSWSSTNATSCTLQTRDPSGSVTNPWASGVSGSKAAAPTAAGSHYWRIDCTGAGGSASADFYHTVVATGGQSCTFNGQTIAHGASVTAYQASTVPQGSACASETRTCSNGVLLGTYQYASCAATSTATSYSCNTAGTEVTLSWNSVANATSYYPRVNTADSCPSGWYSTGGGCAKDRVAGNSITFPTKPGSQYGWYLYASINGATPNWASPIPGQQFVCAPASSGKSCALDGQTITHGSSRTFYSLSSVVEGTSCSSFSQTRTCTDGALSGDITFKYASCSMKPTLVGANYNLYKACFGPGGSHIGTQPNFIVSHYQKPGVRDTVKAQLKAMRGNSIESLRTLVFFANYPTQEVTGVINIDDPVQRAALVKSIDEYASDVQAAGYKRLVISFNPMGYNSPLDYVRAWLVPEGQPIPGFDPVYVEKNLELIGEVRAAAVQHETAGFEVELDLFNEVNTALMSADSDAVAYIEDFWRAYVDAYGPEGATFATNFVRGDTRRDTAAFLAALKRSNRPFPSTFLMHFYTDSTFSGDSAADLTGLIALFDRYGVPVENRNVEIAEMLYNNTKATTEIWNAIRGASLQVTNAMVWPWRSEDLPSYNNACAQNAPLPYHAEVVAGILKNGPSITNSDVVWASYYATGMGILIKKGVAAAKALFISTYDASGKLLRSMVPYANMNPNNNVHGFPISALEHKLVATSTISVRLWESDGSQSAAYTIGPCGGESYSACGGLNTSPKILSAGYVVSGGAVWVRFKGADGAWPSRIDVYDSEYNLLRSVTDYRKESTSADFYQLSYAANDREKISLNWRQYGGGRDVRLRIVMPDGTSSQLYQLMDL